MGKDAMGPMDGPKVSQVREIAEAVVKDNFLELFELKSRPQGGKLVLTVVIDKKSGPITVEDCSLVSRDLEKRLDELDLIETAYLLEVSSPGLDRPLRNLEDCERFKGRTAQFVFHELVEGQMSLQGKLGEIADGKVEVKLDKNRNLLVSFEAVKTARLVVEI